MSTFSETISLTTGGFSDIINITNEVTTISERSAIESGLVTIFCPGSTGAVTTIEYESGALKDLQRTIKKLLHQIFLMSMINAGAMAMVFPM
ncbi:MAG TPA: hypothetical protein EYP21_08635 [Syntrophaceae bacterium]|nr:hypothetical protein [Syntrophaceae bacterium]